MNLPGRRAPARRARRRLGRGAINPVKKWWWDIEADPKTMQYVRAKQVHARGLNLQLDLKYEDQTLAVYPADVMPPPFPVAQPINREQGIQRYRSLLAPAEHKARLARGETEELVPQARMPEGPAAGAAGGARAPRGHDRRHRALRVRRPTEGELPGRSRPARTSTWSSRPSTCAQYSLAGDPADRKKYVLGVQARRTAAAARSSCTARSARGAASSSRGRSEHFPLGGGRGEELALRRRHRCHAAARPWRTGCTRSGAAFELHYSVRRRTKAGSSPTSRPRHGGTVRHATRHRRGTRADLTRLVPSWARRLPPLHLRRGAVHGRGVRGRRATELARRGAAQGVLQRARAARLREPSVRAPPREAGPRGRGPRRALGDRRPRRRSGSSSTRNAPTASAACARRRTPPARSSTVTTCSRRRSASTG